MRTIHRIAIVVILLASAAAEVSAANVADFGLRINGANFRNGTVGTYTIYVANAGPQTANDRITLNIKLPAGFTFRAGGGNDFSCSAAGRLVTCIRTTPMPLGSADFFLQVNVCSALARVVTEGTIAYSNDDNLSSNYTSRGISVKLAPCAATPPTPTAPSSNPAATPTATATATSGLAAAPADIAATLTRASTFRAGGSGRYTLSVSNQGGATSNAPIQLTLRFATGLSFRRTDNPELACGDTIDGAVTCILSEALPPGEVFPPIIVDLNVSRSAPPTGVSSVRVVYPNDPDLSDNFWSRPVSIRR